MGQVGITSDDMEQIRKYLDKPAYERTTDDLAPDEDSSAA